jgi:uncharacterized protein
MSLPNILRNCSVHINSSPKIGEVEELKLPVFEIQTEEFRGGGMDAGADLDLGMKKMDANFKMFSTDSEVISNFGLAPGNLVTFDFYGHLASEQSGRTTRVWCNMFVMITKIDFGTWQPGKKNALEVHGNVRLLKMQHGPNELAYIDVLNGIRVIDGVDLTAQMRRNLGF